MQRRKGQCAELALAGLLTEITGWPVKRKVRQHDGDHDLEGLAGWSIEVKRYATTPRASVIGWWAQALEQAQRTNTRPVLFYRADRGPWRAVWAPIGGSEYPRHLRGRSGAVVGHVEATMMDAPDIDERVHSIFFEMSVLYLLGESVPSLPDLPGRMHRQPDGDGRDRLAEQWAADEQRMKPGWLGHRP